LRPALRLVDDETRIACECIADGDGKQQRRECVEAESFVEIAVQKSG
jgi:hypothetical protein